MREIISNSIWLFIDKIGRLIVSLFILGKLASYLGANSFGILNYSLAFISLFSPFVSLGLDNIVLQYFVNNEEDNKVIFSSTFYIKLALSFLIVPISILFAYLKYDLNSINFICIVITSITLLFSPFDVIDVYYQSEIKSKIPAITKLIVFFLISILKIYFINSNKHFIYFVWLYTIEISLSFIFIFFIFLKNKSIVFFNPLSFNRLKTMEMLKKSFPIFIGTISIVVYLKVDQIMLGNISFKELGYYSAAIKLSEIWHLIPMIICSSVYPLLFESYKIQENEIFNLKMQILFDFLLGISLIISFFTTFFAPNIVSWLYNSTEFGISIKILQIHIWSSVFVFLGVGCGYFLLVKGETKMSMYTTIIGCVVSIILNLIFLSNYGGIAAAYSSVISQFIICAMRYILYPPSRLYFNNLFKFNYKLSTIKKIYS